MCGVLFIFMQKTRIVNSGDPCDKLTLISKEVVPDRHGRIRTYWNCKCVCGNTIRKREDALFNRKHQSCGCDTSRLQASNAHRIKWKGTGQLGKTFFTACRKNAKKRDIEFGITIEEAWDLFEKQNGMCALSGVSIRLCGNTPIGRKENTASLDRIDSNKGYTPDNIQWVHKKVNIMKNILDESEFIQWCEKIVKLHYERKI